MTTRLDEIEQEYQTKFHQFATVNATIQVLVNNMARQNDTNR
ncbi:14777_t:CDS:2 [Dentiscutata heterogama]|uniref:14777_t:CDS:1 n=1 Tax=Dentiscutata heterogama TaxID=1316150 RepID=A0ACA9KQ78_9GLOM|nr:14777_t:CDS:2 [Dentiscutata heterogama]